MDFLEDETRPIFLFQSRPAAASSPAAYDPASSHRISLSSLSTSLFLSSSSPPPFSSFNPTSSDPSPYGSPSLSSILHRRPQEDPAPVDDSKRRQKAKRSEELGFGLNSTSKSNPIRNGSVSQHRSNGSDDLRPNSRNDGLEREKDSAEEREWTDEDLEMLKKQIIKKSLGKPRRWEVVAEAFNGRHGVQSVIKMSKSMGDAKPEDSDSYSKFLKNRKPDDQASEDSDVAAGEGPVSARAIALSIACVTTAEMGSSREKNTTAMSEWHFK
ncbi:hypothetical protein V2J09_022099 [Rumex salicifolius]